MRTIPRLVRNALEAYHKLNRHYPECIVFFRDGVGMGQLPIVKEKEIAPILDLLRGYKTEKPIRFAEIIVTKRRSERFYTEQELRGKVTQ